MFSNKRTKKLNSTLKDRICDQNGKSSHIGHTGYKESSVFPCCHMFGLLKMMSRSSAKHESESAIVVSFLYGYDYMNGIEAMLSNFIQWLFWN